jgi:hypothetical protein
MLVRRYRQPVRLNAVRDDARPRRLGRRSARVSFLQSIMEVTL